MILDYKLHARVLKSCITTQELNLYFALSIYGPFSLSAKITGIKT